MVKAFRLVVVRLSLLATLALGVAAFVFDPALAKGLILGGLARTAGFWTTARGGQFENVSANRLQWITYTWFALRMVLYALVLVKAYSLDTEHLHGFFGAAAGLMIVRAMIAITVMAGWGATKSS